MLAALGFGRPAAAAGPLLHTWKTFADFIPGKLENLSLESSGRLTLAPLTRLLLDTGEPYIWDMASDPEGTLYLATGNQGRVYRITARGDTSLCFTADEPEIYALAHDGRGSLYIATSPQGRIYRLDRSGTAQLFCTPNQAYIWDMLCDAEGNLWVATGGKAQLLCVNPAGQISVVMESEAEHLRCLTRDGETLYAGSSRPGLVYRIRKNSAPFVLYDTGVEEVHSLAVVRDGTLYAAIQSAGAPAPLPTPVAVTAAPQAGNGESEEPDKSSAATETPLPAAENPPGSTSQLVRIDADGYGRQVWPVDGDEVQVLLPDAEGGLLAGTGSDGRLYRIDQAGEISLLLKIAASQISALHRTAAGDLVLGASNMGVAYRVAAPARRGICESPTIDAAALSSWGTLIWRGQGAVAFETRSGNTRKPEGSWSAWQAPRSEAGVAHIVSPPARFVQWRGILQNGEQAPELREVTLSYAQKNRRPEIDDLVLLAPGDYFEGGQEPGAAEKGIIEPPAPPKRDYKKGFRTAVWQFDDPNRDPLLFALWYRRVEDQHWRRLAGAIAQVWYSWDTTQMADGDYLLRLEASDSLSLPPDQGLRAEKVSPAFLVDNTAPRIENVTTGKEAGRVVLRFRVCDAASAIAHVRVSINAGGWQPLYPVDGLADSLCEEYLLPLQSGLASLEVSIEAADQLENCSMAHQQIKGF